MIFDCKDNTILLIKQKNISTWRIMNYVQPKMFLT